MSAYIKGTGIISSQNTFGRNVLPAQPESIGKGFFEIIAPDYKSVIPPAKLRRMSKILKMGVAAGLQALKEAGIDRPDAMATATALGCTEDTHRFLSEMIERSEEALSPTAFIQSTHNTIGGQLALLLNLPAYNMTYTQRGHSFESALLDSLMMIESGEAENVLLGAIEELIDPVKVLMQRMGVYRPADGPAHRGAIGGEGASFFVLSSSPTHALARVVDVKTLYEPENSVLVAECTAFLSRHGLSAADIDLVVTGRNGTTESTSRYNFFQQHVFPETPEAIFKNLCGEYQTAVGFAVWMAAVVLKTKSLPEYVRINAAPVRKFEYVLICNHFQQNNWSFTLLSRD